MTKQEYLKGLDTIREDFRNHLDVNPLHCGKDPKDADWLHWKKITKLLKEVCRYEIEVLHYPKGEIR